MKWGILTFSYKLLYLRKINFGHFETQNVPKTPNEQKFRVSKIAKMAVFELLEPLKMISRKI